MDQPQSALSLAGPASLELYEKLVTAVHALGPFQTEIKKTSIHLVRNSAFAGVHPRKQHLLLTIKAAEARKSSRIVKAEQVSKNRWHLEIKIANASDLDAELLGWLREAYELCG